MKTASKIPHLLAAASAVWMIAVCFLVSDDISRSAIFFGSSFPLGAPFLMFSFWIASNNPHLPYLWFLAPIFAVFATTIQYYYIGRFIVFFLNKRKS